MSPRRSSRARTTQPLPSAPAHTNSSTSSISSGRAERSTRSNNKTNSPNLSNPRSQSLDDVDEPTKPPPRRTRSGHDEIKEPNIILPGDEDEDDVEEEEEVTRCICGQTDYPGLPSPTQDLFRQRTKKEDGTSSASPEILPDDAGGMFIQCDVCKVWQHGGCVGILDDASVPDEYFCEQCRKNLHKVATTSLGQRYSHYLPLKQEHSTQSPEPNSRDRASRRGNEARPRASAESLGHKRRATMNSRGVYDEEQLRLAIEESKKDGAQSVTGTTRNNKRSRSVSEEHATSAKRQRTGSDSASPGLDKVAQATSSSDEALASKSMDHTPKKIRGAAARNHQQKELREQKERERIEAASRRKTRVERRRGDDSDTLEEPPHIPPPSNFSTPPANDDPNSRSHTKKSSRLPVKAGRRIGRNQYTKDRDLPPSSLAQTLNPNSDSGMRTRSRSRSNVREPESPNGHSSLAASTTNGFFHDLGLNGHDVGRPSRPKHMNPNRTSLNEMKRRVAAILEFVSRAEEEGTRRSSNDDECAGGGEGWSSGGADSSSREREMEREREREREFAALSSGEMLKHLRGRLITWEDEFGRYPRG